MNMMGYLLALETESSGGGGGGIPGVYLIRGGADPVDLPDGLTMPQSEDIGEGVEAGTPYASVRLLYCDADIHDEMTGEESRGRRRDGNLDSQSGTEYTFSAGDGRLVFDVSNGRISFSGGNYNDWAVIVKNENLDWAILVVDFR